MSAMNEHTPSSLGNRFGASTQDWAHFDLILGIGEDLLPVVSNPNATISPDSKLQSLGKTPSRYNRNRQAAGIAKWTSFKATPADIDTWSAEPDLGICVQTRSVRALDVDVTDPEAAAAIQDFILEHLDLPLPIRRRADSSKVLMPITLPGDYAKRTIKTAHGIIEFLAGGQQFIACGTHPGGARYEWVGGLPSDIPQISAKQFESLWASLQETFGVEPSTVGKTSTKAVKLVEAAQNDATAVVLFERDRVKSTQSDGRINIICPFEGDHERESDDSATTYFPANTGGYSMGHFKCLHSPCEGRTDRDFLNAIGVVEDFRADFSVEDVSVTVIASGGTSRYDFVTGHDFSAGRPMGWIVKGVVPQGELGVIYGPPGSGKSFFALDLVMAVARGKDWCGRRVKQMPVGYVAAEGAGGFRNRLLASGVTVEDPIHVLAAVPNLLTKDQVVDLGNAMLKAGIKVLVYDTLARGSAGADENSAKDMGIVIANCRHLHDVTGAMVLLIHHSGKDPSKGARGSNAVLGAVDVEIEITRFDDNRTATVSKLKEAEDGSQFGFKLVTITVGMDEDGDMISSCFVRHGEVARPQKKESRLGTNEQIVWKLAVEMQGLGGEHPSEEHLITRAVDEMPFDPGGGRRDARRQHIERAIKSLEGRNKIKIVDGAVVLIEDDDE